jgi:DNA-binding NarL/FixJ family response regulator
VFIADDHAIVRHGLEQLLMQSGDMKVVGVAANGREVLNAAPTLECDVVILDLSLPKVNGPEVLRRLKQTRPDLRVLVLTMYPEDQYALTLLRSGAAAYLSKDRPPTELLEAIRRVASGGTYVTQTIADRALRASSRAPAEAAHAALTAREHQVFTLIIQGRVGADIAAELNLTKSTVSNHLAKIKEKLGVSSIAEIVRYAHRAGMID